MYFGGLWDVTRPQGGPSKKFHFRRFIADFSGTPGLMAIKLVAVDASRQYASIGMHYNLCPIKMKELAAKNEILIFQQKIAGHFEHLLRKWNIFDGPPCGRVMSHKPPKAK